MQLIFIHGSGGCRESWQHQTEYFKSSVAINLPGHPDGNLCSSIKGYTAWLRKFIHDKGYTDVVLVGHSLGGGIVLQYALDYPEDLAGIIPIGSGGRLKVHPDFLKMLETAVAEKSLEVDLNANQYDFIEPRLAGVIKKRDIENTPKALLNDLKACNVFDVMDTLETISVSLLAIVGDKDIMTPPKYTNFMADKISGARSVIIPGGTHFVFAEKPVEVNQAIEEFIQIL